MTSLRPAGVRALVAISLATLVLALPWTVLGHAELVSSDPADGAVLDAPPAEIVLTFSEALDPAKSHFDLIDAGGTSVGRGLADPEDDTRMTLDSSGIAPGPYRIEWVSAAEDGHLERGELSFTLNGPSPTPEPTATPEPTESAAATPSASASAPASATPLASPAASPSPSPSGDGTPASSTSDLILPILGVIALVAVLGLALFQRRGGSSPTP